MVCNTQINYCDITDYVDSCKIEILWQVYFYGNESEVWKLFLRPVFHETMNSEFLELELVAYAYTVMCMLDHWITFDLPGKGTVFHKRLHLLLEQVSSLLSKYSNIHSHPNQYSGDILVSHILPKSFRLKHISIHHFLII